MKIHFHVATNDDNGNHTGLVTVVEVSDVIYLEGEPVTCRPDVKTFKIAGLSVPLHGYGRWVGNMCWDCALLESADIATIINWLRTLGWSCTEAESSLFDKFHNGRDITAEEIEALNA